MSSKYSDIRHGIESNRVSPEWIQKSNLMNKIITTSSHAKFTLESTVYDWKNQIGENFQLKTEIPIKMISYPVKDIIPQEIVDLNLELNFNFLAIAQWGPRKNIEATIRAFIEEFKDEDVGLILKLNITKNNIMDKMAVKMKLKNYLNDLHKELNIQKRVCKIYLIHRTS